MTIKIGSLFPPDTSADKSPANGKLPNINPAFQTADLQSVNHLSARIAASNFDRNNAVRQTDAPADNNKIFKTTGGTWRMKDDAKPTDAPQFYQDGSDTGGTTLFDKQFYQDGEKWIELNANGRTADLPQFKGKAHPAEVSDFEWQGWREVSEREVPADYSAVGKTVAFANTQLADNQKSLFKRYVVDQNLVGEWDEKLGEGMIDAAIQKGAKIEAVPTGETYADGKTVYAVKIDDRSLEILRGELNDYKTELKGNAPTQQQSRTSKENVAADIPGAFYETGRKGTEMIVNAPADALNSVLFPSPMKHPTDEPNFGRAKVGEMYDTLAEQNKDYKGNPIPRLDTSPFKYDFRSKMMRRDFNGKLIAAE